MVITDRSLETGWSTWAEKADIGDPLAVDGQDVTSGNNLLSCRRVIKM